MIETNNSDNWKKLSGRAKEAIVENMFNEII